MAYRGVNLREILSQGDTRATELLEAVVEGGNGELLESVLAGGDIDLESRLVDHINERIEHMTDGSLGLIPLESVVEGGDIDSERTLVDDINEMIEQVRDGFLGLRAFEKVTSTIRTARSPATRRLLGSVDVTDLLTKALENVNYMGQDIEFVTQEIYDLERVLIEEGRFKDALYVYDKSKMNEELPMHRLDSWLQIGIGAYENGGLEFAQRIFNDLNDRLSGKLGEDYTIFYDEMITKNNQRERQNILFPSAERSPDPNNPVIIISGETKPASVTRDATVPQATDDEKISGAEQTGKVREASGFEWELHMPSVIFGILSAVLAGVLSLVNKRREKSPADAAMTTDINNDAVGGIDFNPTHLDLLIERDGDGMVLPVSPAAVRALERLDGLTPVFLNMRPADVPSLFGVR